MSQESVENNDGPGRSVCSRPAFWVTSALCALALVLALIGVDVLAVSATQSTPPRPVIVRQIVKAQSAAPRSVYYLSASPAIKPGPDGHLHDAFSITQFYVRAGQPVKLVINNTDNVAHSITAPQANLNIIVKPGTHTYTLLVKKAGSYQWFCEMPCDPYSMMTDGYMRGSIIAS